MFKFLRRLLGFSKPIAEPCPFNNDAEWYILSTENKIFKVIYKGNEIIQLEKGYFKNNSWIRTGDVILHTTSIKKYLNKKEAYQIYVNNLKVNNFTQIHNSTTKKVKN